MTFESNGRIDLTSTSVAPNADQPTIQAFTFDEKTKKLRVLDQTKLPGTIKYVDIPDAKVGHSAIKSMMVRGAPCIAAVACLSTIAELNHSPLVWDPYYGKSDIIDFIWFEAKRLDTARPTAVNLRNSLKALHAFAESIQEATKDKQEIVDKLTGFCVDAIKGGQRLNKLLGDYGAEAILKLSTRPDGRVSVLTHCNTGALATVGYGTALGVFRSLHQRGLLMKAYCTETRPYNQGSRLTAWELVKEKMPGVLIADSMVAFLMAKKTVDAVVVGADCVAANGDTANKIGTLQLAIVAKHYGVPFYVAAPTQSFDLTIENKKGIKIELRPANELKSINGLPLAPEEIDVWNPCFDVTPPELITGGIITEHGICDPNKVGEFIAETKAKREEFVGLF